MTAASSFADQSQAVGINNVNYGELISATLINGLTSLAGTGTGKIAGKKWLNQADDLKKPWSSKTNASTYANVDRKIFCINAPK